MDARKEMPDVNAVEGGQDKSNRYKRSISEGPDDKRKLLPEKTRIKRSQSEENPKSASSFTADWEIKSRILRKNNRRKSFRFFEVAPCVSKKDDEKDDVNQSKYTALK